ncbi:mitochondrial-like import inner membrane translocase subunit TIM50-like, partial [Trifolium medium]|nr:mitochondrial-like import inner membrane translocase subunit TIM50-like [Trifolium medium]
TFQSKTEIRQKFFRRLPTCLQPENCVSIKAWQQTDVDDTALLDFIPFLECKLSNKEFVIEIIVQKFHCP